MQGEAAIFQNYNHGDGRKLHLRPAPLYSLGLTPRQNGSGGKAGEGRVSKARNSYLRRLLFIGAITVIRSKRPRKAGSWLARLIERQPAKVVAVALPASL